MNAFLEIDIAVAKAIGLTVVQNKSGSKRGGHYYTIGEASWYDEQGEMKLHNSVPDYSTDIAAALLAQQHINTAHTVNFSLVQDYEGLWTCSFDGPSFHGSSLNCETAPLAICTALLQASKSLDDSVGKAGEKIVDKYSASFKRLAESGE